VVSFWLRLCGQSIGFPRVGNGGQTAGLTLPEVSNDWKFWEISDSMRKMFIRVDSRNSRSEPDPHRGCGIHARSLLSSGVTFQALENSNSAGTVFDREFLKFTRMKRGVWLARFAISINGSLRNRNEAGAF
jgi:hypothetical protein